jgi:hypothetical protein
MNTIGEVRIKAPQNKTQGPVRAYLFHNRLCRKPDFQIYGVVGGDNNDCASAFQTCSQQDVHVRGIPDNDRNTRAKKSRVQVIRRGIYHDDGNPTSGQVTSYLKSDAPQSTQNHVTSHARRHPLRTKLCCRTGEQKIRQHRRLHGDQSHTTEHQQHAEHLDYCCLILQIKITKPHSGHYSRSKVDGIRPPEIQAGMKYQDS